MPLGSTPDMLVVVDGHPNDAASVDIAQRYARAPLALSGWNADAGGVGAPGLTSAAADPTVSEAIRVAAQNKISWITMRRDIEPPEQLLGDLLIAAAHHRDADVPGYAVLLADEQPRSFDKILAIVDRRGGPISGLLAYFGVELAYRAGAQLDILVIGSGDELLDSDSGAAALLAVNRERELYERARQRAREAGLSPTFITASASEDSWAVIRSVLADGYDLVIDDLGAVSLGRGRLQRGVEGALSPGETGEIPLRLLTEESVAVLLVIDEIRLGIAPAALIKAGAAAAITLGVASSAVLPVSAPAAASQVQPDDDPALVDQLQDGIDAATTGQRSDDATTSSRSVVWATTGDTARASAAAEASATEKSKKISTPKGGVDPQDVAKARTAAAKSKAKLAKAQDAKAAATKSLSKAEKALAKATAAAEEAKAALETAQAEQEATLATAERAESESTGLRSLLPGSATDLEAAVARADSDRSQEELASALTTGGDALADLTAAQVAVDDGQDQLREATTAAEEAKVGYTADQATFEVYQQSLASTRQSPVAKGDYRLTARFGDTGGLWSSGMHTGLDFAGKTGTDITAAASGKVVSAGYDGPYGNRVVVDIGDGYTTTYNHMSAIKVSVGQSVTTGDLIGKLGGTGNVTGPHLHFEVTHNDKFVDPQAWLGW